MRVYAYKKFTILLRRRRRVRLIKRDNTDECSSDVNVNVDVTNADATKQKHTKTEKSSAVFLQPHPLRVHTHLMVVVSVTRKKIAKYLFKLPKNDFTRKMIDFDSFTKIP